MTSSTSLTDYYNSRVNLDKLNPLIRSAYNTTFDFNDYKQQLLTKVNYSTGESTSTLKDSLDEIRREQSDRLAQLEREFQNLKKPSPVFDLPFYAQEKEEHYHQTKPPVPTASRRSPSPIFDLPFYAQEEEIEQHYPQTKPPIPIAVRRSPSPVFVSEEHHVCHRPYHVDTNRSDQVENHIHSMWNEYELEDYLEKPK